jgi:hypothetical protein
MILVCVWFHGHWGMGWAILFLEMFSWGALGTSPAHQIEGTRASLIHGTRCRLLHPSRVPLFLHMASELSSATTPDLLHTSSLDLPAPICSVPTLACLALVAPPCSAKHDLLAPPTLPGWARGSWTARWATPCDCTTHGGWAGMTACNRGMRQGWRGPMMQWRYNKEKLWAARLEEDVHERMIGKIS